MNYIDYDVFIEKFSISAEMKINSSFQGIKEVSVIKVKGEKDTKFRFLIDENITDIKIAESYCQVAINEIMNIFAWHTGGQVGIPKRGNSSFSGLKSSFADLAGSINISTSEEILNLIKADIENPKGNLDYLRLYRFAFLNEDNVSKFLILYSILYSVKKTQKGVDTYIKSKEPSVEEKPSTKNQNNLETVYTYLRNQIGHIQENSDGEYIREKVQNVLGNFIEIVKIAINEEYQQP